MSINEELKLCYTHPMDDSTAIKNGIRKLFIYWCETNVKIYYKVGKKQCKNNVHNMLLTLARTD